MNAGELRSGRSLAEDVSELVATGHQPATQAAILNALPACIALLDADGTIASMNDSWRHLSSANVLQGPGYAVGVNYLAACERGHGAGAGEAREAAAGIRSVLAGRATEFELEYYYAAPQRWFLLTVTALDGEAPRGAIVMHREVTARKQGEERLRRLSAAIDATADGIYLVDRASMRFVYVNAAACRMRGQTREELEALGPAGLLSTSRAQLEQTYDAIIASGRDAEPLEVQRVRKDGSLACVELRRHASRSPDGWMIVTLARDVTQRKAAERRIERLNRVYAVLSGIDSAILRIRERGRLFDEVCRIAVAEGGFALARVIELDEDGRARIAASTDPAPSLFQNIVDEYNLDPEGSKSMLRLALRGRAPLFSNDVASDERIPYRLALTRAGSYSLALLPLMEGTRLAGTLLLRTQDPGAFDENEKRLLLELTGNISFALEHIEGQARLEYLAYYDALTGLANRALFLERVAQYLRGAVAGGHRMGLFLIDLERFKDINDSLGRPAGDLLLKLVAEWLTLNLGDSSLLARLAANQFGIVLPKLRPSGNVGHLLEKTMAAFIEHPFHLEDAVFRIPLKAGAALFPQDGTDADTLLNHAEAALKRAKAGGDRYLFYAEGMTATPGRLTLENQLRRALDNGEFVLHYQPKANLASGLLTGAEALIRWNDPHSGLVPPGRFIPVLEETGMIHDVGRWALRRAIADHLRWRSAGLAAVRVSVNVSPLQLRHPGFIAEIEQAIGVDPHAAAGLEIELTESLLMADVKGSIASLRAIRAMGITVAIDDFGTGFSSLSYLAKLPVDTLKIDRSFITGITTGPQGLALVSAIINLAHALKLNVVAEGVETEEELRMLRLLDCDETQGFLFSKPVPPEEFEARFLAARAG